MARKVPPRVTRDARRKVMRQLGLPRATMLYQTSTGQIVCIWPVPSPRLRFG